MSITKDEARQIVDLGMTYAKHLAEQIAHESHWNYNQWHASELRGAANRSMNLFVNRMHALADREAAVGVPADHPLQAEPPSADDAVAVADGFKPGPTQADYCRYGVCNSGDKHVQGCTEYTPEELRRARSAEGT